MGWQLQVEWSHLPMREDAGRAGARARERGEGADIRGRDTQKEIDA